jgi:hypothetical protein
MTDRFDAVHNTFKDLTAVAEELKQTSFSLRDIGLDKLADRLWGASRDIFDDVEKLRNADAAQIHERFQLTQQSATNVLKSCLAAAALGREDENDH